MSLNKEIKDSILAWAIRRQILLANDSVEDLTAEIIRLYFGVFSFSDAVDTLRKALKEDEGIYYSYQANIAVAFQDEYARSSHKYKNRTEIHRISNEAAKNFLNALIG